MSTPIRKSVRKKPSGYSSVPLLGTSLDTPTIDESKESSSQQLPELFESERKQMWELDKASSSPLTSLHYSDSDLSDTFQPNAEVLDTSAKLFMMRHHPYMVKHKTTDIDPLAVGCAATLRNLREDTILQDELRRDENSMEWRKKMKLRPCPCDIAKHPSTWTSRIINGVHDYSFLLECKDLVISNETIVGLDRTHTLIIIDVPMFDGTPWKIKAEQVMRFIDVEAGLGDQTAYDLMYYRQPFDRKILLLIKYQKIIGLVLAEKLSKANRILTETDSYIDLEVTPVPVKMGINRLWIHVSQRRHHFGTVLCELVGRLFFNGKQLERTDYAFNSSISDMGIAFAKLFLKMHRPPLYKGKAGVKI